MAQQGYFAEGTIQPNRFVAPSLSYNFKVKAAGAGDAPIGITTSDTLNPPLDGASTYHAASGDPVSLYGMGVECLVEVGTGGVVMGDFLKSESGGKAVTATANTDFLAARANESGAEGTLIRCQILTSSK